MPVPALSTGALDALLEHAWPGNVRELQNVIEAALLLAGSATITEAHLPDLGARVGIRGGDALGQRHVTRVELERRDASRGGGNPVEGGQAAPDQHGAADAHRDEPEHGATRHEGEQLRQQLVDRVRGHPDDQAAPTGERVGLQQVRADVPTDLDPARLRADVSLRDAADLVAVEHVVLTVLVDHGVDGDPGCRCRDGAVGVQSQHEHVPTAGCPRRSIAPAPWSEGAAVAVGVDVDTREDGRQVGDQAPLEVALGLEQGQRAGRQHDDGEQRQHRGEQLGPQRPAGGRGRHPVSLPDQSVGLST